MSVWRRKAIALFPDLRSEVQRPDFSIYMLFFRLLPMVREAHDAEDVDLLRRIYGFAEWCFSQKAKDMWNAAGVAFYEHLFDEARTWGQVIPWLPPQVLEGCWGLWEFRLSQEETTELRERIADCCRFRYLEASLTRQSKRRPTW